MLSEPLRNLLVWKAKDCAHYYSLTSPSKPWGGERAAGSLPCLRLVSYGLGYVD